MSIMLFSLYIEGCHVSYTFLGEDMGFTGEIKCRQKQHTFRTHIWLNQIHLNCKFKKHVLFHLLFHPIIEVYG